MSERITTCQQRLQMLLPRFLPHPGDGSTSLAAAMHYGCLNGGKRLRPLLIYSAGEIFGSTWEPLDPLAVAIECLHCYSLLHDDLPAMDNDDLRRGKPTCHKVFGEATAILAGDALLTLAFEILATHEYFPTLSSSTLLKIIQLVSGFAGANGMVLGQSQDMQGEKCHLTLNQLIDMHTAKTGALITASVQCGALATDLASKIDLEALHNFGQHIGLAFQIQDDMLDAQGNSEMMGKQPGQDVKNNKSTFVTLLGLEPCAALAQTHYTAALDCLTHFGNKAASLRTLCAYLIDRKV